MVAVSIWILCLLKSGVAIPHHSSVEKHPVKGIPFRIGETAPPRLVSIDCVGRGGLLPCFGRGASSASHLSGPVPARNAGPPNIRPSKTPESLRG
jgi:hypothetical protein